MHIKKSSFYKLKIESKFYVPTFDDTYYAINISHLQTAFYLLMLGYVLAVVFSVTEIFWHCYRSKGRGRTSASVMDRHKYTQLIGLSELNMLLYSTILYDVSYMKQ